MGKKREEYKPKRSPLEHQKRHYDANKRKKFYALFWEQGCVDADTEFLSQDGWKKISDYEEGDLVTQWYSMTGDVELVEPEAYIDLPSTGFYHFKHDRGLDQMVCGDHIMPTLTKQNKNIGSARAGSIAARLARSSTAIQFVPNQFYGSFGEGAEISDAELRVQVAVNADGSFPTGCRTNRCTVSLKKTRKIKRLRQLLSELPYDPGLYEREKGEYTLFSFNAPLRQKDFSGVFKELDKCQMMEVVDEIFHWDGNLESKTFYTRRESDADYIQLLFGYIGKRASKRADIREDGTDYRVRVYEQDSPLSTIRWNNITPIAPVEGERKYCFSVPSGYLLLRRNGNIFPTGNCGKSKGMIDDAGYLFCEGIIDFLVVVAPNGIHANWVIEELPKDMGVDYEAMIYYNGKGIKWERELMEFIDPKRKTDKLRVLTFPVEGFTSKKAKAVFSHVVKNFDVMCCIDESDKIGTHDAMRTKYLLDEAPRIKARRIGSGTPVDSKPLAAWSQMQFLSPKIFNQDFWSFRSRYAKMVDNTIEVGGKEIKQKFVVGYKNLKLMHDILAKHSDRVLKEDCVDLPDKIYKTIPLEMSAEQRKYYKQMEKAQAYIIEEYEDQVKSLDLSDPEDRKKLLDLKLVASKNSLDTMGKLSRITGGFVDKGTPVKGCPKLKWLKENADIISATGKLIIWARYRDELAAIKDALGDAAVVIHGGVQGDDREEAVRRFKEDDDCKFMVANTTTMGAGYTLTNACDMVYFSNDYSLRNRRQSEDRIHRISQTRSCTYYDLVLVGTLDVGVLEQLKKKRDVSDVVMGDPKTAWVDITSAK